MNISIAKKYIEVRSRYAQGEAVPQLNLEEGLEMERFLVWLMQARTGIFMALSVDTFAMASAIAAVGVLITTGRSPRFEAEHFVRYAGTSGPLDLPASLNYSVSRDFFRGAQQVSYRRGNPEHMIQSIQAPRDVLNKMGVCWTEGVKAAKDFCLTASAELPFGPNSDIRYQIDGEAKTQRRFTSDVIRLQGASIPRSSDVIMRTLERITKGMKAQDVNWLEQHTQLEYLRRSDVTYTSESKQMEALLLYQSLVFGFYYRLLEGLIVFNEADTETYFQGIWGLGSNKFMLMCAEMGNALEEVSGATRTQLLYMLSTMYNGRQKVFTEGSSRRGLVGILGSMSIVTQALMRPVDRPQDISKFLLFDLPIVDLAPEADGEIYAGRGTGIRFDNRPVLEFDITPRGPRKVWTMHAKMGVQFQGSPSGVVIAARCAGRVVGWFDPLAADVLFLSTAYCATDEYETPYCGDKGSVVRAVEIKDEHWQSGCIPRPVRPDTSDGFVVVHSMGNPVLRYAAAGFFGGAGEEVAISTGDIEFAFGRIELQESGVIIA